jgi:hypothetical protein
MNRLLKDIPTTIVIDSVEYKLNTNYDGCLWVWDGYEAVESGELSALGYAQLIIDMMYNEPKPSIFDSGAVKFAADYLNAFSEKDGERKSKVPPISIRQDWEMIFSSLLPLGIDIRKDKIDYEAFLGYLRNLPEGCEYARIMNLRIQWYEERGKMKSPELKRLKENIERIGADKVIIRDKRKEK